MVELTYDLSKQLESYVEGEAVTHVLAGREGDSGKRRKTPLENQMIEFDKKLALFNFNKPEIRQIKGNIQGMPQIRYMNMTSLAASFYILKRSNNLEFRANWNLEEDLPPAVFSKLFKDTIKKNKLEVPTDNKRSEILMKHKQTLLRYIRAVSDFRKPEF